MRTLIACLVLLPMLSLIMPADAGAQMTPEWRAFIVAEHNRLRRDAVGAGPPDFVSPVRATAMLEIQYDMALECVAQGYIDTQTGGWTGHNPNRTADYAACGGSGIVGESWFSARPDAPGTGGAVRAWTDYRWPSPPDPLGCSERENYHGDRGCSGWVGHYTQVLWSRTYKVGCGYSAVAGTVCNYSPGGNFVGVPPFVVGAACSACPDSHPYCNNGLCSATQTTDPLFFSSFELLP